MDLRCSDEDPQFLNVGGMVEVDDMWFHLVKKTTVTMAKTLSLRYQNDGS